MSGMDNVIATARRRIETVAAAMSPTDAAEAALAAVPLVGEHDHYSRTPGGGKHLPKLGDDPAGRMAMAAVGAGIEAPLDLQLSGFVGRRLQDVLDTVVREQGEREDMETVYVDHGVKRIAGGSKVGMGVDARVAKRLVDAVLPTARGDAKAGAALLASLLAGDQRDLAWETLQALNEGIDAAGAKALFDAMDGSTKDWVGMKLYGDGPLVTI